MEIFSTKSEEFNEGLQFFGYTRILWNSNFSFYELRNQFKKKLSFTRKSYRSSKAIIIHFGSKTNIFSAILGENRLYFEARLLINFAIYQIILFNDKHWDSKLKYRRLMITKLFGRLSALACRRHVVPTRIVIKKKELFKINWKILPCESKDELTPNDDTQSKFSVFFPGKSSSSYPPKSPSSR